MIIVRLPVKVLGKYGIKYVSPTYLIYHKTEVRKSILFYIVKQKKEFKYFIRSYKEAFQYFISVHRRKHLNILFWFK